MLSAFAMYVDLRKHWVLTVIIIELRRGAITVVCAVAVITNPKQINDNIKSFNFDYSYWSIEVSH